MKKFLIKNKRNLGLILIVISVGVVFLPLPVNAVWYNPFTWVGDLVALSADTLLFISSVISSMFGAVFGVIIYLEAQIIDYLLSPTNFPITGALIVKIGWGITRDLANMFFILILLIISFATVLRIKSLAISQLWWKVVVAALLINFSLVIAGFVIDFANILTNFFVKQAIGGGGVVTITTKMMSAMQILNFYNPAPPEGIINGATQFGASAIAAFAGIILTLIGLLVTIFVFGAAMIFLVARLIHLWILLVFAPIVWMLWILPATSSYFSQWWNKFIHWTFFAPIFAFMMFLSLSIFDNTGKLQEHIGPVALPANWTKAEAGITTAAMPAAIFQFILAIGLMFGSLIVAQKFGVYGADASQKMLTGWGNSAKGWAGRQLRKGGAGWTQPLPEGAPPPTGVRGLIRRAGAGLGRAAVAVPGARGAYLNLQAKNKKDYEDAQNKYKDVDPVVLEQMAQSKIMESRDKLAIQQLLISKGRLKPQARELMVMLDQFRRYGKEEDILKLISDKMKRDLTDVNGYVAPARAELIQRAKRYKNEMDFLKLFPNLAPVIGQRVEDTIKKIEKASEIYEDQLTVDLVKQLNPSQMKDIARSGTNAQRRSMKISAGLNFNRLSLDEMQSVNNVLFEKNTQKREELRKSLPEDLRRMSHMKEITTTPAFEYNI